MADIPNSHQVLLAFDYGSKRIGVAIGQTITQSARPLVTLENKNERLWDDIRNLIKKWRPDALLIGIPLNMDGTPQLITQKAREFAQSLHELFSLPIYEIDERLTTKSARETIFNKGGYKALQDGQVDQVAAQLMLENWFRENIKNRTDSSSR